MTLTPQAEISGSVSECIFFSIDLNSSVDEILYYNLFCLILLVL